MPGALKLPTISSLCHSRKLHAKINWARCTAAGAAGTGRFTFSASTTVGEWWWWCRLTPCSPSAIGNFPQPSLSRTHHLLGFRGQKYSRTSWTSSNSQQKRQGYNCHLNTSGLDTSHMGPTPSDHNNHHLHRHDYDDDGKKPPPPPPHSDKLLTLPTILTIARVAAVPLLVATFYVDSCWGPNVATGIFIAAAITDWLDGYLARKMKQGTAFGAFLDPVADKLMVAATLVLLCTKPLEAGVFRQAPWLLTVPAIAIIGREITMSAVREWAASQDGKLSEAVAVNNLGKWKTATQMTALTILLATRDSSLAGSGTLVSSGVVLLYISAWLSVWSLVVYMRKIWKVLLM